MKLPTKSIPILSFFTTLIPLLWGFMRYPKLLADESIYVSQAWWLIHFKELGPYTYWYDHSPFGWFVIGIWQKLTGGPFFLGIAEFSGRLLSILLVSATAACIASILQSVTQKKLVAIIAVILYATSPLGLVFHRQILLENIAVFFFWCSLWLLIVKSPKYSLWSIVSAILFGVAILTKESLLFFIPAYFMGYFFQFKTHTHRNLLILLTSTTIIVVVALFPLLAILKGEFIQFTGSNSTISLVHTMLFQMGRGNNYPWWDTRSEVWQRSSSWLYLDPIILIFGAGATVLNLITTKLSKKTTLFHILTLSYVLFLLRGGLVLDHYIIPLISLFAVEISLFIFPFLQGKKSLVIVSGLILSFAGYNIYHDMPAFNFDAVQPQQEAYKYVSSHAASDDVIIFDNYFLNLRFNHNLTDRFPNTEWHSKIDTDPLIANRTTHIDWLFMDWITKTQINSNELPLLKQSFDSMNLVLASTLSETPQISELYKNAPYVIEPIYLYSSKGIIPQKPEMITLAQISKLIWIPLESYQLTKTERLYLQSHLVAGIIVQQKNILNSNQLQLLIQSVREASSGYTPIIAISFEGGSDTPIPWLTSNNPSGLKSLSESTEMASKKAKQLSDLGFNVILGPIFDGSPSLMPKNLEFSYAIAQTYQQSGLIPFVKWFSADTNNIYSNFLSKNDASSITGLIISPNNSIEAPPLLAFVEKTHFNGPVLAEIPTSNLKSEVIQTALSKGVTMFYISDLRNSDNLENITNAIQVDGVFVNKAIDSATRLEKAIQR